MQLRTAGRPAPTLPVSAEHGVDEGLNVWSTSQGAR